MNKKSMIIGLLLFSTLLFSCTLGLVTADIAPDGSSNLGDYDINNNLAQATAASQNVAFYSENLSRWYVMYPHQYSGGDWAIAYSYSDSGDKTTWTSGGILWNMIWGWNLGSMPKVGYYSAWVYDNENEIGHIVFSYIQWYSVKYHSFTLDTDTGEIILSSSKSVDSYAEYHVKTVNIDIDVNGYPIIATCEDGNSDLTERVNVFFADAINGTGATWTNINVIGHDSYNSLNIIPTNTTQKAFIILGALETNQPIFYKLVEVGVTANGTSAISISDYTAFRTETSSAYMQVDMVSSSYNETHGAISYTRPSPFYCQVILFDFATVTTTEYAAFTSDGFYPVTVMDRNEFAVFTVTTYTAIQDLYGVEMHNATYDGFFNSSSKEFLFDNLGSSNVQVRGAGGGSAFTNSLNETLYIVHSGDYVKVGFVLFDGEYGEPPTPPVFIPNWLDLYFSFGCFLAGVILMLASPSWLAFSIRRGLKNADETIERAIFALILFAVGYCLVIGYLGGFS